MRRARGLATVGVIEQQELEALEVDPNTDAVDSQEADSTAQEGGEEGEEQQLARTAEAEDESVSSKAVDSEVSFDKSMELASDGELEDFKEDEEEPEGEDEEEEDREREAEADAEADAEEESERSPEDRDLRSVASEESTRVSTSPPQFHFSELQLDLGAANLPGVGSLLQYGGNGEVSRAGRGGRGAPPLARAAFGQPGGAPRPAPLRSAFLFIFLPSILLSVAIRRNACSVAYVGRRGRRRGGGRR